MQDKQSKSQFKQFFKLAKQPFDIRFYERSIKFKQNNSLTVTNNVKIEVEDSSVLQQQQEYTNPIYYTLLNPQTQYNLGYPNRGHADLSNGLSYKYQHLWLWVQMWQIQGLSLARCPTKQLTGISPEPYQQFLHIQFPSLKYLNLSDNKISSIEQLCYHLNAPFLQSINLGQNQICSIRPLRRFSNPLLLVNLRANHISDVNRLAQVSLHVNTYKQYVADNQMINSKTQQLNLQLVKKTNSSSYSMAFEDLRFLFKLQFNTVYILRISSSICLGQIATKKFMENFRMKV